MYHVCIMCVSSCVYHTCIMCVSSCIMCVSCMYHVHHVSCVYHVRITCVSYVCIMCVSSCITYVSLLGTRDDVSVSDTWHDTVMIRNGMIRCEGCPQVEHDTSLIRVMHGIWNPPTVYQEDDTWASRRVCVSCLYHSDTHMMIHMMIHTWYIHDTYMIHYGGNEHHDTGGTNTSTPFALASCPSPCMDIFLSKSGSLIFRLSY